MRKHQLGSGVIAGLLAVAGPAFAQHTAPQVDGSGNSKSSVGIVKLPDPNSPTEIAFRESQKKRASMEKDLRKIRAQYFRGIHNTEIRQVGLGKLREFTDPAVYPTLLELFKDDEKDVRSQILQMLIDQKSDEADAAIAWAAVFDGDKWFRQQATERLLERTKDAPGGVSNRVKSVIALGLRDKKNEVVGAAAQMAGPLKLYEAIPMMISSQVTGAGTGGGGGQADDGGDAALAIIVVAKQIAFVSDLTPVVGDSAVAFDPTLSVATDGVYLRVIDAVVITYRTEVNMALIGLANAGWDGRDTSAMGWDQKKWRDWYANEFKPYREKIEAAKAEAVKTATPG